jgi:hypothetical protein
MQYRAGLLDGFLAKTRLDLGNPTIEDGLGHPENVGKSGAAGAGSRHHLDVSTPGCAQRWA